MSWLFSQALVEEYSPDKCSDGAQSVQSSGKPTQRAYLQRDKTTDTWNRFPSGMTCEPLTEADGEAVLTSFLAAFPAKTSAQPEKAQASTASDPACGWKWPASSVKYDPDSRSWRTRQCSLLGGLVEFSETWPRWGSMRNGECWEVTPWACVRKESESGLSLMRPTASDGLRHRFQLKSLIRKGHQDGNLTEQLARVHQAKLTPNAAEILMQWPPMWTALNPSATVKCQQSPQPPLSKAAGG